MAIDISERYKLIFEEHHYASDFRVKIFQGWCVMYAALAVAFAWVHAASRAVTWTITSAGIVVTVLMWLADVRNRAALRASKDAGGAIEQDAKADIPENQQFFTRLATSSSFEKFVTHSWAINIFSIVMILLLLAASWYLWSRKGALPE